MSPLLAALLACSSPASVDSIGPGAADDGEDTAPVEDTGRVIGDLALSFEATDMATVWWLSWEEAEAPVLSVEVTVQGERILALEQDEPADSGRLQLRGLPTGEQARVWALGADDRVLGAATLTVGSLGAALPELAQEGTGGGGWILVPILTEEGSTPVIIDASGRYVWAWPVTAEDGLVTRLALSADHEELVVLRGQPQLDAAGVVEWLDWEGHSLAQVPVVGAHTDHAVLPDGRVAVLTRQIYTLDDGTSIVGDGISLVSRDGAVQPLWEAIDAFQVETDELGPQVKGTDPPARDWSHVNGLSYDPDTGLLLATAAFDHRAFAVDVDTGATAWCLTNDGQDPGWIAPQDPELRLPHSVHAVEDGVLIFNRGAPDTGLCSQAVRYRLPAEQVQAEAVWTYASDDCMEVVFLGSAVPRVEGGALVSFSSQGRIDEVDYDGDALRSLGLDIGAAFGFAERVDEL